MKLKENQILVVVIFTAVTFLFFLSIIKYFNISYPISVTNQTVSGELAVVGEGKVEAVPNNASVQVGIVVSDASNVKDAQTKISQINNKIVAAMEKLGINKKDIKTTNYSINPNYNYQSGQNQINGYSGNATLTITVKKQDQLPNVVTAATEAGANQIYDTQYSIDDPAKYREEARSMAIQNAKDQAQKLASQLGIRLGKVVNIVESSPNMGAVPVMYDSKRLEVGNGGAVAPSLQAGTQTITSIVTLYFEKR